MRGQYRRIYPETGRLLCDGGLNTKYARSIIQDNESPDCKNVVFQNGAVETRQGITKLNQSAVGSYPCDGIYTRRDSSNYETMCAWFGGTLFTLVGNSFTTIGSAQSIFTQGVRVGSTQAEDYIFFGNGGTIPYKYNGTDFTRHGVYPPTTTLSVASNGTGALDASADYRYKVTWVNSALVESDVGPVSATFTISATSGQNRLTSIPVAPQSYGINTRRIYRTEGNGTTFYRLATISDNTTTTYDDNTPDASLGATAPTDNGVLPKYNSIVYHQGRLWMNDTENPNYVWYTELNNPYTVASASNFFRVGDNSTDLVKAVTVYQNSVVVYCEKSIWMIYMQDTTEANWSLIRVDSAYGSKSPYGMIDYNRKQLYPAVQNGKFVGFAALNGATSDTSITLLTVLAAGSDLVSDRIETDMFSVQEAYLGNISGIVFKNRAYLALTYGSGNTTNNRVYVMDFSLSNASRKQHEAWSPFTGWSPAQFTIYDGKLYFGTSDSTGFVYRAEAGVYNDDGTAIDSYYWTKELGGVESEVNFHKDFRYANLLVENTGDYYMNVGYRTNSDSSDGQTNQVSLDPGGSLWGVMEWGVDVWGGGMVQKEERFYLGPASGKRIQLKFTNQNTTNQRFKVHGINLVYNIKGFR